VFVLFFLFAVLVMLPFVLPVVFHFDSDQVFSNFNLILFVFVFVFISVFVVFFFACYFVEGGDSEVIFVVVPFLLVTVAVEPVFMAALEPICCREQTKVKCQAAHGVLICSLINTQEECNPPRQHGPHH
jgi:hypothetical protein